MAKGWQQSGQLRDSWSQRGSGSAAVGKPPATLAIHHFSATSVLSETSNTSNDSGTNKCLLEIDLTFIAPHGSCWYSRAS